MTLDEQIEFINYATEALQLEMTVLIKNIKEERDCDTLLDIMIKKLISRRMIKTDPCEILTTQCI